MLAVALLMAPVGAAAQEQPTPEQPTPEQMQQMLAAMQPGPEHERLAKLVGTWDVELTFSMMPGQMQTLRATSETRTILGGRFLVSHMESPDSVLGIPIGSVTILGYDRRIGEWTILGLDTFGTYWVSGAGKGDISTNPVVMGGAHRDPFTGREEVYDFIVRFVDEDTWESSVVFKMPDGQEFTAVTAVSRRRQ